MNTHRALYLPLAGLALFAHPGPSPLKMIYAVWEDSTGAANAIAALDNGLRGQIESYAIVTKGRDGTVQVREKHDRDDTSALSVEASQTIDSVVALLNEPAADGTGHKAQVSAENLTEMKDLLQPGESALLLMAPRPPIPELKRSLGMEPGDAEVVEVEVLP